ncbi:MAG: signal peptidase II [Roseiarcus sp.]
MKARSVGGLAALAVLIVDQASKFWLLHGLGMKDHERIAIAPFLDFELLWNPGISFSLFPQGTATGRWVLLGVTLAATALLGAWLWRVDSKLAGLGLGAIVGGALGNGYDRFAYNAVVDFLDFHAFGYHWYVFNIADSAITLGVALLLYDSLVVSRHAVPSRGAGG